MTLIQYLSTKRGMAAELAQQVGSSAMYIRHLAKGRKAPSVELAHKIECATKGLVSRPELRSDWAAKWPDLVQD